MNGLFENDALIDEALAQYRKIAAFDVPMANKLYAVIYSKLLVTVSEK